MNTQLQLHPSTSFDQNRTVVQLRITRLILLETTAYNPMYLRPYTTHVTYDSLKKITDRVEQLNGQRPAGSDLAGVASDILMPSATPGEEIQIPNGWGAPRIRFVLEVECAYNSGTTVIYYFQGFTDFPGVSAHDHIAPDMHFFINSMIGVSRVAEMTPTGVVYRDRIYESAHYLTNFGYSGSVLSDNNKYAMRPYDMMTGIEYFHISGENSGYNHASHMDTRNIMKHDPLRSNRSNGIAASYLANVIDAHNASIQAVDYGVDEQTLYAMTQKNLREALPSENPFIRRIGQANNGQFGTNCFTFGTLQHIDPNVVNVINHAIQTPTQLAVPSVANTEHWQGATRETVLAAQLAQVVPAIMLELLLMKLMFTSTNDDFAGKMTTQIGQFRSLTTADMTRHCELFKRRLEAEVLYDITNGNQETYALSMNVDIFGETRISLSLNGGRIVDFVTPSFCDNLMTPVVSGSLAHFNAVAGEFEQIIRHCGEVATQEQQTALSGYVIPHASMPPPVWANDPMIEVPPIASSAYGAPSPAANAQNNLFS